MWHPGEIHFRANSFLCLPPSEWPSSSVDQSYVYPQQSPERGLQVSGAVPPVTFVDSYKEISE